MKLPRLIFCLSMVSFGLSAQTPATPSRLLCMYFDLNSMDAAAQSTTLEAAVKFVQQQATPADRITVMTYTAQVNVLQDFTSDHDRILAALRTIMPTSAAAPANPGAQLAALQQAVEILAPLQEKKALIYFSQGIPRDGADNQDQLRATTNAAIRANVAIYSVDSRGLGLPPR